MVKTEHFLTCVLSDTKLEIDGVPYPYIDKADFGDEWIELRTLVRYSPERSFAYLVKPLREAKKIAIALGTYPTSARGPQVQRTFAPVRLVTERYESKPIWQGRGSTDDNKEGHNAPVWYCTFRFEVQS